MSAVDTGKWAWNSRERLADCRALGREIPRGRKAYLIRRGHKASCGQVYYLWAKKQDWTYQMSHEELMIFLEERKEEFPDYLDAPEETTVLNRSGRPRIDLSEADRKRRLQAQWAGSKRRRRRRQRAEISEA